METTITPNEATHIWYNKSKLFFDFDINRISFYQFQYLRSCFENGNHCPEIGINFSEKNIDSSYLGFLGDGMMRVYMDISESEFNTLLSCLFWGYDENIIKVDFIPEPPKSTVFIGSFRGKDIICYPKKDEYLFLYGFGDVLLEAKSDSFIDGRLEIVKRIKNQILKEYGNT